jgi:metallo-beta-lactamase family protein
LLLPDSGHLQEEQARHANTGGYSRHHPALPLYTRDDAEACLGRLVAVDFHAELSPAPSFRARFDRAGHILGAASLALDVAGHRLGFSGDVGRPDDPLMLPPEPLAACDTLVIESTYGDRRHPREDVAEIVAQAVRTTVQRGGTVVVPAFAVGRAQHLLYLLAELTRKNRIPAVPIYLDSPMAIDATEVFVRHPDDHRLSRAECERVFGIAHYTRSSEESKAIDQGDEPKIVLSASGMATGGRVLHHLRRFLPDAKNTVVLVGYQVAGTRGCSLRDGADEVKIHGQYVPVRAKVVDVESLSAHADYAELLDWLGPAALAPRRVFVTHGEPASADAMRRRLADRFGWTAITPPDGATFALE